MDLFIVKNKTTGKQVGKGFDSKGDAKTERNRLQAEVGKMPPPDKRQDQSLWQFSVSPGKDHRVNKPVL